MIHHYCQLKSLVYIRGHFLCCAFSGLWLMWSDMHPLLQNHAEQCHCPKKPLCSVCSSSLPSPTSQSLTTSDLFPFSTVLPSPECHKAGIVQYVPFPDWLLSLHNMHLGFPRLFVAYLSCFPLFAFVVKYA